MADDNDKALYDDLRIAQLAMEDLTTAAPCIRRDVCSSVDADHTMEQQEIESALPTVDLVQPGGMGPTGDAAERGRRTGADVTCSTRLGNTKARRVMDGKKFHLKGLNHRDNGATTDGAFSTMPSSSRIMISRRWIPKLECASCFEKFSRWKCVVAPCSHVYCRKCTVSLIDVCIEDESLYPVKCCKQPLSKTQLSGTLNAKRRATFELKSREFSTSPDLRTYCSNPQCSTFLGSSSGRPSDIVCRTCRTSTCIKCRQRSHSNETCQGNAGTLKVQEMARKEGWQTCPGCKTIVELHEGCFHMTCRCRTEFCYLCGSKWKRCKCMQWHEDVVVNAPVVDGNGAQNVRRAERSAFKHILMRWIGRLRW